MYGPSAASITMSRTDTNPALTDQAGGKCHERGLPGNSRKAGATHPIQKAQLCPVPLRGINWVIVT